MRSILLLILAFNIANVYAKSNIFHSNPDCRTVVNAKVFSTAQNRKGTFKNLCQSDDCRAIVNRNERLCQTQDCHALVNKDSKQCQSDDCRAILELDSSQCSSQNCQAIVRENANMCNFTCYGGCCMSPVDGSCQFCGCTIL